MKKLMEILMELDDSIDWENETALIDERILDSFGVISLISELEEQFDIEIEASEIIPQNLNSADAMWKMIQRLQENSDGISYFCISGTVSATFPSGISDNTTEEKMDNASYL